MTCRADVEIADLVEEECPSVGKLELTDTGSDAGCDSTLDTEELTLEQCLGKRGTVHRNQRPIPLRALMQETGDQLLTGSALSADEQVDAPGSDPLHHVDDLPHRLRFGDEALSSDLVRPLLPEELVLLLQAGALVAQTRNLPQTVEGHCRDRRERREESTVLFVESERLFSAVLFVEHGETAHH